MANSSKNHSNSFGQTDSDGLFMGYLQSIYHDREYTFLVYLFVTSDIKLAHEVGIIVVIIIIVATILQGN